MTNNVIAYAVTGIDSKLIQDAESTIKKSHRLRPVYALCAVAACLVLVFIFIFALPANKGTQLLVNGCEITDTPVSVRTPASIGARGIDLNIELSLNITEKTKITISAGEMSVCSKGSTDTLYYTGTEYTTDIPVNIHWNVDGSDITKSYTLTLGEGETVYKLYYDESTLSWLMCKK